MDRSEDQKPGAFEMPAGFLRAWRKATFASAWGRAKALLGLALLAGNWTFAEAGTPRPYYQRRMPAPQREADFDSDTLHIDFRNAVTNLLIAPDPLGAANQAFDQRAAAAIRSFVGIQWRLDCLGTTVFGPRVMPTVQWRDMGNGIVLPFGVDACGKDYGVLGFKGGGLSEGRDLLEFTWFGIDPISREHRQPPPILTARRMCLAAMAYQDYFPNTEFKQLRGLVAEALAQARPGYSGTFGPGVEGTFDLVNGDFPEGNYDFTQMFLIPLIYRYYDELPPEVREHVIVELLAHGLLYRVRVPLLWTHGVVPEDWSRAGFVSPLGIHMRIGETENHLLMIATTRYLVNQLLYQRNPNPDYDNRRNGGEGRLSGTSLILTLLRRVLVNDFSEYNAKNYQAETRWALLNLCSYAYDHEVRLGARMVLDYISARMAVSSCDLRRLVPFRRRNEPEFIHPFSGGYMNVGLVDGALRADPSFEPFAIQTGNLRALATTNPRKLPTEFKYEARPWETAIASNGEYAVIEALSDYRLPPSIHDLFVNDLHRRFFQRLRRVAETTEEVGSARNVNNMEIYAGSPSYLITAGGEPGPWALDPGLAGVFSPSSQKQQLGVAVPTSFMPTGQSAGPFTQNNAEDLIQFSHYSDGSNDDDGNKSTANYGVGPDFACGHRIHLPSWAKVEVDGRFLFVNKGTSGNGSGRSEGPGFYLAILQDGDFACLEALDTWLHPDVSYEQFKSRAKANNANLLLQSDVEATYTTYHGTRLHFVIWNGPSFTRPFSGADVLRVEYGSAHPNDRRGDAGNIQDRFLNGTILNSIGNAVVEIANPGLRQTITLNMADPWRPMRVSETGEIEQAGPGSEVWVDFGWTGPSEGDFYRPFKTLSEACAAVAQGGVVKVAPGSTRELPVVPRNKRFRIEAPLGGVRIGVR